MRVAAIIIGTEVVNVVVIEDGDAGDATIAALTTDTQACVEITGMYPMPGLGLGWSYVDGKWIAPEPEPAPPGE